jgi:uncharacterized protein
MLWKGRKGSDNIEDRRGKTGNNKLVGGSIGAVVIGIIIYLLGGDPSQFFHSKTDDGSFTTEQHAAQAEDSAFVGVVLAETESIWQEQFNAIGKTYQYPKLTLFDQQIESACGFSSAASGPFYCPGDGHVYIDLSFFNALKDKYKASGDFAMAYVVAHEIGHHVQNLLGTTEKTQQMKQGLSATEANKISVKVELQADFYAGIWAHYTQKKQLLESGDIEEALNAANAIGDDKLQLQSKGRVIPDAFTHGTSAQRMAWFKKGLETGDISQGNTFNSPDL